MYTHYRRHEGLSLNDPDYSALQAQIDEMAELTSSTYNTVLDYGAGNAPYRQLFNCATYLKADIEQNCAGDIDIILDKNSPELPLADASIDLVVCMDVLEHVYADSKTLATLYRVLKPDSQLVMSVPFIYREHEFPFDYRRYSSAGITALLQDNGFGIEKCVKLGNSFYVAANLLYERNVMNGEIERSCLAERILRRLYRMLLPLLNRTLFAVQVAPSAGVFSRLLVIARKPS